MARKSQHSFSKRQREQKKAEKAADKRARRAARGDDPATPTDDAEAPLEADADAPVTNEDTDDEPV